MLFIVIPAYNEEQNLSLLIPTIIQILYNNKIPYKIIIANDGSRDGTKKVAESFAKKLPIQVVNHEVNKGIGAVFNSGLKAASDLAGNEDVIILMEADCTNDPAILPVMFNKVKEGYSVVIGSRYLDRGGYHKFPIARLGLSIGANYLLKLLFPIKGAKDYTIFFRAYSANILKKAFRIYKDRFITSDTFVANVEILLKLESLNINIYEIPLFYNYELKKGKSGMNVIKTLKEYVFFIISEFTKKTKIRRGEFL